ncbi:spore germination protein KC [Orenia metallireducens]|jgi:spore germination protein KC|uniref:Spore germination protein KC n=1 Tax=Orenia metallireducens TaxID=1413210 RepID=A0A285G0N0_9FIRM|nr:Ger(x)C family spore germination protein [Orenia metallireducens]SNY16968.1 spore germination protein KC [Orenia metallireducens]
MSRRFISLFFLLLIVLSLTACAGKREMDELGIVGLTGVDWDPEKEKYELIVQVMVPSKAGGGMGGSSIQSWNATANGRTLMRASKNLRSVVSKKLVWFHSNLIIIGERAAKKGLKDIIDFFARNKEIRYNSWVLISQFPIKETLESNPRFEGSLPAEIAGLIENNQSDWSESYAINLKDMLIRLADDDFDEVTGRLTNYEPKLAPEGTYEQLDLTKNIPEDLREVISLSGDAVLKDGKLVGWLDRVESKGYLFVVGEIEGGAIVEYSNRKEKFSAEILSNKSKLKPEIKDGKIHFKLDIKTDVAITEAITDLDLTKNEDIESLQKNLAKEVETEIKSVLWRAQQDYGADIFGYGNAIYRSYPKKWEEIKDDWDQIFPTVVTDIKVEIIVKRLGMISQPITKPQ